MVTPSPSPSTGFSYADLFAGVGGFAAVLRAMGGSHAYAVEIDRAAAGVYARNWDHDPLGDITEDANDEVMTIPSHDVLVGGFPCQPFSKSGAQRGMDEVRGTLFFHIEKAIRAHKPTLIVLENVRNIAGPRHRHEWEVIINHLRDVGYQVSSVPAVFSPHKIAPEHGGAPQVRERVFITATLVPEGMVMDPEPEPVVLPPEVQMDREWDLFADLPIDDTAHVPGTELSEDETRWINHWEAMVQVMRQWRQSQTRTTGEALRRLPGFPIWADAWVSERQREALLDGAPKWKADFLRKNFDLYDALRDIDPKWMSTWLTEVRRFPESRRKLEWQAQDSESLWDCVISFRPSGLRAKRPTHLPALVAITQTPVLGPLRRKLSAREAARLQGLPDTFDFGDQRDALTFKQMGNGVNTGVVWNVIKAHVSRDRHLLEGSAQGRALLSAVSEAPSNPRVALARAAVSEFTVSAPA
ncbi:DNA (cytosine-5-)-methyltransferase [Demequina sp. SO4-13]|uniref:DNA (cytosine-5-)-methyltransferase n=1 Tax=Demequina sp. SO4-13 TaxID=3401027 RepID=UPI003AF78D38